MFKLIRLRKKRMKERRKKWLKRSRPRSEHQKNKKLNDYIMTRQPIWWFINKKVLIFFSRETFIFSFSLLILFFISYILCNCAPQSIRWWGHGMFLIKSILSFLIFFPPVQDQTQIHVMDWILGWLFVKVVPSVLALPKYRLNPLPLPTPVIWALCGTFPPRNQPG